MGLRVDPLSQSVLGAAAAQSAALRQHVLLAGICGLLAGLAPDLDALVRSDTDPLLALEYHRQFIHALIFIPLGGLICAGLLHCFVRCARTIFVLSVAQGTGFGHVSRVDV